MKFPRHFAKCEPFGIFASWSDFKNGFIFETAQYNANLHKEWMMSNVNRDTERHKIKMDEIVTKFKGLFYINNFK